MSIYVKIGKKILKNPNIIRPHVKTKDISELNFKKMKDMGMEKIIFDNNLTLNKLNRIDFLNDEISESFTTAVKIFGKNNVIIVSETDYDKFKADQ